MAEIDSRLSVELDVPPASEPVRIVLAGELDGEEVTRFQHAVAGVPLPGDDRELRIEGAGLTFIDSAGIRALLNFRERAEESGARVIIGRLSRDVYRVMQIARLIETFQIDGTVAAD